MVHRAELKSAMDGLNAAAGAKDAKVRDAMSALADDYRQIRDPSPPASRHRPAWMTSWART